VTAQTTAETMTGGVLGTPAYMAPEQCRGEAVTPATDWYGVGVVLYEALTGELPYTGNAMRILLEKQEHMPAHPRERAYDAPEDLAALCMRLLQQDPALRPDGAALLGALLADNDVLSSDALSSDARGRISQVEPAAGLLPFVGRSSELARLREHFARTRSGGPALAYLSGESGVGKSALARAFAEELAGSADALVLRSRCYERETVPYKAFDGIVDDLARHLSKLEPRRCRALLPTDARLLMTIFPMVCSVKPLLALPAGRVPRDPNVMRSLAFAALREILARLSLDRPVLLVIDDLQWTDLDSLSLMEELLNGPEAPACMVVATGRPLLQLRSELGVALEPLLAADFAMELPLSGLGEDEAEQLARALLGPARDSGLFRRIAVDTKGHPLFVAELVRHVEAGHALGESRQLDEALCERIAALSGPTRGLLETLAVASTPTTHAVLAKTLELDPIELTRRLTQLRSAHLVRSENRRSAECYHDRVRRAVLEALPEALKRQRHRALAGALSELGAADAEQVAYQWRCAGDLSRAARYCAEAAEAADRALAFKRAARLYDEALSTPEAFEPERMASLKVAHARALSCAGFAGRAAEVYLDAAQSHGGEEARALRRQATQLMLRSGRVAEGLELADAVLAEVGLSRPKTPTRAVLRLAWERTRLAARGLDYAPRPSDAPAPALHRESLDLLWAVAPSLAFVDFLGGSALQSMYARMALASGDRQHLVRSLTMEALLRSMTEPPAQPRVAGLLQRVRDIAEATSNPYLGALVWMSKGYAHWVNFRSVEAISALVQAERLLREQCVDVAWELTNVRAGLLNALWNNGRFWQHDELAEGWQRDARECGDRYAGTQLVAIGVAYQGELRRGQPGRADEVLRTSLDGWTETFQLPHWCRYIGRQLVALYRGDGGAYALYRESWPAVQRSQLLRVPYMALLSHSDAAWACLDEATRESGATRAALLDETLTHARQLLTTRWAFAQPLADQIRAQASLLAGRRDEALVLLQRAETSLRMQHSVYQYPTSYLAGSVLGSPTGRALSERALAWAEKEGIADPRRWFQMFAPALRALA
jgi:hypothetical protein